MRLKPELVQAADILWQSRLFVDITGDGSTCHEKSELFLVLAGLKPVGEVLSGHMKRTSTEGHAMADDPLQVIELLTSLGLCFDLSRSDDSVIQAVVSLDQALLDQFMKAEQTDNQETIGRLLGYPATACAAFAAGTAALLSNDEANRRAVEAGIQPAVLNFRLSKKHWRQELTVAAQWQELLTAAGFIADNSHIILYGAAWCADCKRSRAYLDAHNYMYTYIDIDTEAGAADKVAEINDGLKSIPTIVFPDGTVLVEPTNQLLADQLVRSGIIPRPTRTV